MSGENILKDIVDDLKIPKDMNWDNYVYPDTGTSYDDNDTEDRPGSGG